MTRAYIYLFYINHVAKTIISEFNFPSVKKYTVSNFREQKKFKRKKNSEKPSYTWKQKENSNNRKKKQIIRLIIRFAYSHEAKKKNYERNKDQSKKSKNFAAET